MKYEKKPTKTQNVCGAKAEFSEGGKQQTPTAWVSVVQNLHFLWTSDRFAKVFTVIQQFNVQNKLSSLMFKLVEVHLCQYSGCSQLSLKLHTSLPNTIWHCILDAFTIFCCCYLWRSFCTYLNAILHCLNPNVECGIQTGEKADKHRQNSSNMSRYFYAYFNVK